jgi:hypothetical protein
MFNNKLYKLDLRTALLTTEMKTNSNSEKLELNDAKFRNIIWHPIDKNFFSLIYKNEILICEINKNLYDIDALIKLDKKFKEIIMFKWDYYGE